MKYIKYDGYSVSKLSLGTVQFGIDYGIANVNGKPTQTDVNNILQYLFSQGINSFDTAKGYGNSEEVIGKYFETVPMNEGYVISKIDSKELKLQEVDFINSIKVSISKLKIEGLFGLLMHNSTIMNDWNNDFGNKISLLKQKGLIKYFGVSIYSNEEFEQALDNNDIDIIQIPYNLFDQRAYQFEWFKKAKQANKLIFIRSIYLQGLLLMNIEQIPEKLSSAKQYLEILDSMAKKLKMTKNELSLSFVNSTAKDSILLFGCETVSQAKENLEIFDNIKELDINTIKEINHKFKDIDETIYNPTKWV